jgi:hypothetical protein
MMKINRYIYMGSISNKLLYLIIYFFLGCNSNEKIDPQSLIFKSYLKSEFKMDIANKNLTFFIIPSTGCLGCNKSAIDYFIKKCVDPNNYLIVTNKALKSLDASLLKGNILIDKRNWLEHLDIDVRNTSLLIWDNNKIQKIDALDPENIQVAVNNKK